MNKKIFLFPLISILCFSSLNYFSAAEAKRSNNGNGQHSNNYFHQDRERSFNNQQGHFRNNFQVEEERVFVNSQRHYNYHNRPVFNYVYRPNIFIYSTQLDTYDPGTYCFYDHEPAYRSYRQAIIIGLFPRLIFSNGTWVLIIE